MGRWRVPIIPAKLCLYGLTRLMLYWDSLKSRFAKWIAIRYSRFKRAGKKSFSRINIGTKSENTLLIAWQPKERSSFQLGSDRQKMRGIEERKETFESNCSLHVFSIRTGLLIRLIWRSVLNYLTAALLPKKLSRARASENERNSWEKNEVRNIFDRWKDFGRAWKIQKQFYQTKRNQRRPDVSYYCLPATPDRTF